MFPLEKKTSRFTASLEKSEDLAVVDLKFCMVSIRRSCIAVSSFRACALLFAYFPRTFLFIHFLCLAPVGV